MNGLAARAHPFTVVTMTLSAAIIAFLLPGPFLPLYFYLGISLLVLVSGVPRALRQAAVVVLPLWAFLVLVVVLVLLAYASQQMRGAVSGWDRSPGLGWPFPGFGGGGGGFGGFGSGGGGFSGGRFGGGGAGGSW